MPIIAFALQGSGNRNCEKAGCSVNKCPQPKDQKKMATKKKDFQSKSKMMEEPLMKASPQVVMTLATTTKINGVLLRMGTVLFILEISLCVCVE